MEYVRESIILSSVRSFCKSFATLLGVLFAIIIVSITLMMFSTPDLFPPKSALQIAPDAQGNRDLLGAQTPVILKLNIKGVIGQGDLIGSKIENCLFDSREGMLANNRVKALLLHINSPGGTSEDIDKIYRAIMDYKNKYQIPVFAFVDGMCASGGMYLASCADKIFATNSSIIGSVGVILGPVFNWTGLMDRYGVQALTLTEGKDKDALNSFRAWVPGEDASIKAITTALYKQFVDIVTKARPQISAQKLIDEYGAQVFISEKAQELGYIDVADANYSTAVGELAAKAGFSDKTGYQVVEIGPIHSFFSDLTEGRASLLKGQITHQFQLSSSISSELSGKFLYLYQPN